MSRKGENITKRKDGRWEARVIKGYDCNGKAQYAYLYGRSYPFITRASQRPSFLFVMFSPFRGIFDFPPSIFSIILI